RAVGTGFRFISAFTDRLVLCAPSDFFKSVFQFSSIFCSVLAQTVEEPKKRNCFYWGTIKTIPVNDVFSAAVELVVNERAEK
ncbi:MAG: hypothetical protein IKB16_01695, partial [Lentisphaeria bacterium]|nr:hypothetical protein [Lentisphaeria bacterium]